MYLGGVPNMDILPKPANVSELFEGCIGEVRYLCAEIVLKCFVFFCMQWLKPVCSACLGFHQQQESGSVLQLHREQIYPQVCGQQPL